MKKSRILLAFSFTLILASPVQAMGGGGEQSESAAQNQILEGSDF